MQLYSKAIEIQRSRIQKLREDGQYSEQAEHVLKMLENFLDALKRDRDIARAQVGHCEVNEDGTKVGQKV